MRAVGLATDGLVGGARHVGHEHARQLRSHLSGRRHHRLIRRVAQRHDRDLRPVRRDRHVHRQHQARQRGTRLDGSIRRDGGDRGMNDGVARIDAAVAAGGGPDRVDHAALVQHRDAAVGGGHHAPGRARAEHLPAARPRRRERRQRHRARHRPAGLDGQQLGAAEAGHPQARPIDRDVAEIALQLQRANRGAAGRRDTDQLAVGARDVHQIARRVVGEAARRCADRAPRDGRLRLARVEGGDGAAVAERHVDTTGGVLDDAARFVARLQHHRRRDGARREIDDVHAIAIGIGGDGDLSARQHAKRPAADRRGRDRRRHHRAGARQVGDAPSRRHRGRQGATVRGTRAGARTAARAPRRHRAADARAAIGAAPDRWHVDAARTAARHTAADAGTGVTGAGGADRFDDPAADTSRQR